MMLAGLGLMAKQHIDILNKALPGSLLKWKQKQEITPKDKLIFMQDGACPLHSKSYLVVPWGQPLEPN